MRERRGARAAVLHRRAPTHSQISCSIAVSTAVDGRVYWRSNIRERETWRRRQGKGEGGLGEPVAER